MTTDELEYISKQYSLAHVWLLSVRKCKCELDPTSGECKHIEKALKKLYGKRIDMIWNEILKKGFESLNQVYGFRPTYELQKTLSAE